MHEPQVLFAGKRFRVESAVQRMPDGTEHAREVVRHPGAVALLPILDDGRVCLIENYRVAVGQRLLELPAGTLEPGEEPEHTARRELTEETGYRAGRIERLATFYTSPGILDEKMFLYLATDLHPGPMAPDAGEDISVRLATWDEAMAMLRDNRIQDGKSMAGLLYYDAFRRRSVSGTTPCAGAGAMATLARPCGVPSERFCTPVVSVGMARGNRRHTERAGYNARAQFPKLVCCNLLWAPPHIPPVPEPTEATAVITTMRIASNIRQYSTAVAAVSLRMNRRSGCIEHVCGGSGGRGRRSVPRSTSSSIDTIFCGLRRTAIARSP